MRVRMNGKVWDKEAIQTLIDEKAEATARALLIVYANQTAAEKSRGATIEHNGIGFSSRDAEFLTDVARKYRYYGRWASERQLNAVRKRVRRYWKQVLRHMADQGGEVIKGRLPKAEQEAPGPQIQTPAPAINAPEYGAW